MYKISHESIAFRVSALSSVAIIRILKIHSLWGKEIKFTFLFDDRIKGTMTLSDDSVNANWQVPPLGPLHWQTKSIEHKSKDIMVKLDRLEIVDSSCLFYADVRNAVKGTCYEV